MMGLRSYFSNYPKHVFFILSNEFCERFSFYGMKAILVIYLTRALQFEDKTATALYHAFNVLCYFTPIIGAIIADGCLGRFKTILYLSIIYLVGLAIVSITAIPFNGSYVIWAPFIGLAIIGFGTGGIKPCVSSFGGDQFNPSQQRQKDSFFSLYYMSVNIGSLISTILTPLLRSQVHCFNDNCYSLAFGIPAILMLVSIVVFVLGSRWYTKIPPGESLISRIVGCIWTAILGKCCCSKKSGEEREHWLDHAEVKYDKRFIADVKDVLRVCWLFLPLPIFWALYDQQGSTWTLQATQMNGDLGGFTVEPDMMQMLNALLVVICVPLLESLIYPCFEKLKIPTRPLQRIVCGMILAAVAFLVAGLVQITIDKDAPVALSAGQIKLSYVNAAGCPVSVTPLDNSQRDMLVNAHENTQYFYTTFEEKRILNFTKECGTSVENFTASFTFDDQQAYQIFFFDDSTGVFQAKMYLQEKVSPTPKGESIIRVYNALNTAASISLTATKNQEDTPRYISVLQQDVSPYQTLIYASFYVDVTSQQGSINTSSARVTTEIESTNGAVYTVVVYKTRDNKYDVAQLVDVPPHSTSILLQIPQYIIITLGECLFSVTGLAFAYTQASVSMKSILSAVWLLTIAVGNVVVIIVAESGSSALSQMAEFFLFAALLFVTTIIFIIMTQFYEYVQPRDDVTSVDEKQPPILNDIDAFIFNDDAGMQEKIWPEDIDIKEKSAPSSTTSHRGSSTTPYNAEMTSL